MPRSIDVDERRAVIGDAVWRVILRDGLDRASVRNVAREAGLSMGSLRHYFGTQAQLLAFSMELVIERVRRRAQLSEGSDPLDVLSQALPLDEDRLAEAEVWLAFTARARVDETLDPLYRHLDDALRGLCEWAVATATGGRLDDAGAYLEAEALYALIDGLALHAVMESGEAGSPHHQMDVVRRYLARLVASAPAPAGASADGDAAPAAPPPQAQPREKRRRRGR
jgi:AcrR family transcriptional regulator